jgi:hypothetical protein
MFHHNNPNVIESNDIVALRHVETETLPDGTIIARLAVELSPHKSYADKPSLHLTDGVLPRILHLTPVTPEEPASSEEEPAAADDNKKAAKK